MKNYKMHLVAIVTFATYSGSLLAFKGSLNTSAVVTTGKTGGVELAPTSSHSSVSGGVATTGPVIVEKRKGDLMSPSQLTASCTTGKLTAADFLLQSSYQSYLTTCNNLARAPSRPDKIVLTDKTDERKVQNSPSGSHETNQGTPRITVSTSPSKSSTPQIHIQTAGSNNSGTANTKNRATLSKPTLSTGQTKVFQTSTQAPSRHSESKSTLSGANTRTIASAETKSTASTTLGTGSLSRFSSAPTSSINTIGAPRKLTRIDVNKPSRINGKETTISGGSLSKLGTSPIISAPIATIQPTSNPVFASAPSASQGQPFGTVAALPGGANAIANTIVSPDGGNSDSPETNNTSPIVSLPSSAMSQMEGKLVEFGNSVTQKQEAQQQLNCSFKTMEELASLLNSWTNDQIKTNFTYNPSQNKFSQCCKRVRDSMSVKNNSKMADDVATFLIPPAAKSFTNSKKMNKLALKIINGMVDKSNLQNTFGRFKSKVFTSTSLGNSGENNLTPEQLKENFEKVSLAMTILRNTYDKGKANEKIKKIQKGFAVNQSTTGSMLQVFAKDSDKDSSQRNGGSGKNKDGSKSPIRMDMRTRGVPRFANIDSLMTSLINEAENDFDALYTKLEPHKFKKATEIDLKKIATALQTNDQNNSGRAGNTVAGMNAVNTNAGLGINGSLNSGISPGGTVSQATTIDHSIADDILKGENEAYTSNAKKYNTLSVQCRLDTPNSAFISPTNQPDRMKVLNGQINMRAPSSNR